MNFRQMLESFRYNDVLAIYKCHKRKFQIEILPEDGTESFAALLGVTKTNLQTTYSKLFLTLRSHQARILYTK